MEHEINRSYATPASETRQDNPYLLPGAIIIGAALIAGTWIYDGDDGRDAPSEAERGVQAALIDRVLPIEGVELPVLWGDLGTKLTASGAIDKERFIALYQERGAYTDTLAAMLERSGNGTIVIDRENAEYLLNLFWALGLAQENEILTKGEMITATNGNAGGMASTGGWSLARGNAMDHYSMHRFFDLAPEEQALVDRIARGIYRPCCGNSTHFPDCNHGMAMLGLLELMASQGATEEEMWDAALAVNAYWFPQNYVTIATYMEQQGTDWEDADPRVVLGAAYSSGQGFADISSKVVKPQGQGGGGGGCSV